MELQRFTIEDIRSYVPCYDPVTGINGDGEEIYPGGFLPEDWTGTALDILAVDECPDADRLWVVLREGWMPEATLQAFARWCALQVIDLWDAPDVAQEYLETGNEDLRVAAFEVADASNKMAALPAVVAASEDAMVSAGLPAKTALWLAWEVSTHSSYDRMSIYAQLVHLRELLAS